MKYNHIQELPIGKFPQPSSHKKPIFLVLFFITLTTFPFYLRKNTSPPSLTSPERDINTNSLENGNKEGHRDGDESTSGKTCNLFNGTWVPYFEEPYYTNETCHLIIDQQNCMKFGRPDRDYLKWRWKPDDCELPLFDALQFLELVKGKSLAFLGDSVGKNQMHSLLCLLTSVVGYPEDVSEKYSNNTAYFKRYIFHDYNFTVATLWAPFLVQSIESDPNGYSPNSQMNLYLDEPNDGWSADVQAFDFVVVSAGQWFFRPVMLHENRSLVGCSNCGRENVTDLTPYYAYRRAFRTVFRALLGLQNYTGTTFLRTFSPSHFENGAWNAGGSCARTRPFGRDARADFYVWEMHKAQVEEFVAAREVAEKRGLVFRMVDTTEAMFMRPDGHPNFYGHSPHRDMTIADCVHWCLPGPIDTWNEILLYMLRTLKRPLDGKL